MRAHNLHYHRSLMSSESSKEHFLMSEADISKLTFVLRGAQYARTAVAYVCSISGSQTGIKPNSSGRLVSLIFKVAQICCLHDLKSCSTLQVILMRGQFWRRIGLLLSGRSECKMWCSSKFYRSHWCNKKTFKVMIFLHSTEGAGCSGKFIWCM